MAFSASKSWYSLTSSREESGRFIEWLVNHTWLPLHLADSGRVKETSMELPYFNGQGNNPKRSGRFRSESGKGAEKEQAQAGKQEDVRVNTLHHHYAKSQFWTPQSSKNCTFLNFLYYFNFLLHISPHSLIHILIKYIPSPKTLAYETFGIQFIYKLEQSLFLNGEFQILFLTLQ